MPEFVPDRSAGDQDGGEGVLGGHLMARALRAAGIDTIFGLCGGHILGLLDGCLEEGIRVIDTRHEGAASLAAEGWALATGDPGLAAVTAGPGFANAMIGFMDAAVWSVPVVLFAGRTGLDMTGKGAVMDVDQEAVAAPIAKRTVRCLDTARIPNAVMEAIYAARSGCPGAVYLEIPQDVFMQRARPGAGAGDGGEPRPDADGGGAEVPAGDSAEVPDGDGAEVPAGYPDLPTPQGATEDIERALEALERAEKPVIVAGTGAFFARAGAALERFAETAGIPVTTTSGARGLLPDSHPWCLGTLVHAGAPTIGADVVLVLGSAFNANLAFGRPPLFQSGQTLIQVDIDPGRLGGNRRPDIAVVGDVGRVLEALSDAWRKSPNGREEWRDTAAEWTAGMRSSWDQQIEGHDGERLHAGAVVRRLVDETRAAVGDGVTFVADGGDALTWGLAYMYAEGPGRMLATTTALGTLGVGLPFALAAQAARPDERTILFTGDGAFGLTAMELDTAARHGLPVITVVSNNHGWRDVSHEQDAWFGVGRRIASDLAETRYDRLAQALDCHGEHVTELDQLGPALRRSLDSGQPAVINVETDPDVLSELLKNVGELGIM